MLGGLQKQGYQKEKIRHETCILDCDTCTSSLSERNGKALVFKHFADPAGAIFRRKTALSDRLLVGGIIGYAIFRSTGWLGTGLGVVLGILAGTVLYAIQTRKAK